MKVTLTVNGRQRSAEAEPNTLLINLLRDDMMLTGAKYGCGVGECGACTVLLDGRAVKSCTVLAVQADGGTVATIEGVAADRPWGPALEPGLHPMQAAFVEHHGLQCGFCTPGMIMAALDLVGRSADPSDAEIRDAIHGNLCRCTGYQSIVASIRAGAAALRAEAGTASEAGS